MKFRSARILAIPFTLLIAACDKKEETPIVSDCSTSTLSATLVAKTDASTCLATDGQLEVNGIAGMTPYVYALNAGSFQANPSFISLAAGTYSVTVRDAKQCTFVLPVVIGAANSTLAATFDTTDDASCDAPHTGTIIVTPTGGVPPYELNVNGGAFGAVTTFTALAAGMHSVMVRDGDNCSITLSITIDQGDSGVSYASQISPILIASCAFPACHGPGSGNGDWTVYSSVKARAASIKARTGSGSMPPGGSPGPDLSALQIKLIACWVNDGAPNN